ncbi:MAG: DegV family protein [Bacilli bacterium]|nr:DegV family protein [Bacilli bacterium]
MKKVCILTDCTSDLNKELYEKNNIVVLPLYVTIGGKTYSDGVDITTEEIYQKVAEFGELPRSSAIGPVVFEEEFKKLLKEYDEIIYMGIGSGFSGTYNNAVLASQEVDPKKIFIVDSGNLSSGIGLLVLKAAKFRSEGFDGIAIKQKLEEIVPMIRTQFAIDTLEYLHKGGRCTGTAKIFGTLLKMKPIIKVENGAMKVAKKPMGKFSRALGVILDYVRHDLDNIDPEFVMVTHSLNEEDATFLKKELAKMNKFENIYDTNASGVISTHCGPKTIGILYILEK